MPCLDVLCCVVLCYVLCSVVQIGNIFSGLYLSVRNTSTVAAAGLTAIRKPGEGAFEAHIPGGGHSSTGGTQDPAAGSTSSSDGGAASLSGARAGHGLCNTSQRAKWSQEAYLQDKLRAGAAAVKVRDARGRHDQGPGCPILRGVCCAGLHEKGRRHRVAGLTSAPCSSWMGCACCLVALAHTLCVQDCMHATMLLSSWC